MTAVQIQKHIHIPAYICCRICGRYITQQEAKAGGFCTDGCAVKFTRCNTCGKYFPLNKGYHKIYCSADCAVQYKIEYLLGDKKILHITEVEE